MPAQLAILIERPSPSFLRPRVGSSLARSRLRSRPVRTDSRRTRPNSALIQADVPSKPCSDREHHLDERPGRATRRPTRDGWDDWWLIGRPVQVWRGRTHWADDTRPPHRMKPAKPRLSGKREPSLPHTARQPSARDQRPRRSRSTRPGTALGPFRPAMPSPVDTEANTMRLVLVQVQVHARWPPTVPKPPLLSLRVSTQRQAERDPTAVPSGRAVWAAMSRMPDERPHRLCRTDRTVRERPRPSGRGHRAADTRPATAERPANAGAGCRCRMPVPCRCRAGAERRMPNVRDVPNTKAARGELGGGRLRPGRP
jgi:hypothetical protein